MVGANEYISVDLPVLGETGIVGTCQDLERSADKMRWFAGLGGCHGDTGHQHHIVVGLIDFLPVFAVSQA